jgi:hypothetical protein
MGVSAEVWERWRLQDYDALRQMVLVFGGNLQREAALEIFSDVSLLYQEGEGTNTLKGVFYVTTNRLAFIPNNTFPHPKMVWASFDSLRLLAGVRSDLTVSLTDRQDAAANFQFPSTASLFHCFNLIRGLAEAWRKDDATFRRLVAELSAAGRRDETPFASIEVELPECTATHSISDTTARGDRAAPVGPVAPVSESRDRIVDVLQPVRAALDYCNHLRFDVHIKMRILFFVSSIAFLMKYVPFLPLVALVVAMLVLYRAWICRDSHGPELDAPSANVKVRTIQTFLGDWFEWRNKAKSFMTLQVAGAVFIGWAILPPPVYGVACVGAYIAAVIVPIYRTKAWKKFLAGFWFCT